MSSASDTPATAIRDWLQAGENLFDAEEMVRVRGFLAGLLEDRINVALALRSFAEAQAAGAAMASLTLEPEPLSDEESWRATLRDASMPTVVRSIVERYGPMRAEAVVERVKVVIPTATPTHVFSALYRLSRSGGPLIKTGRRAHYLYAPKVAAEILHVVPAVRPTL